MREMKTVPENHSSIAQTLNNLGMICNDLGDKNKAKEFLEDALKVYRKTLPENHKSIATTLAGLGMVYRDLGDKKKAKELNEQELEIYMKALEF